MSLFIKDQFSDIIQDNMILAGLSEMSRIAAGQDSIKQFKVKMNWLLKVAPPYYLGEDIDIAESYICVG